MSKIVKLPNAKPITCACCGCIYEFECGDIVEVSYSTYGLEGMTIVLSRKLECPNCRYLNDIVFETENCDND